MSFQHDFDKMAVVGHVADIVHAFKESVVYLKRIQERRRTRPLPPGCVVDIKSIKDLEFSLTRGQDVVRSHYERDYRRIGQSYATGDPEAALQLKTILSELQGVVVANLKNAYQHDQHVDFLMLQDLSDDSQDRAIRCLMQLHQRVLTSADMDAIVAGKPYTGNKRTQPRSRNNPRLDSESQRAPDTRPPHGQDHYSQEQDLHTSYRRTNDPPTPDLSPLQEQITLSSPGSSDSTFGRPKPPMLPIDDRQPMIPTLPSPPIERVLGAPPGPPPTAPLPSAPVDINRQGRREEIERRREQLAALKNEAGRRARQYRRHEEMPTSSFADRHPTDPPRNSPTILHRRPVEPTQYEFQEPHPGTPVDPSRIDEPQMGYGGPDPRAFAPAGTSQFSPARGTSLRWAQNAYDHEHYPNANDFTLSPSEVSHSFEVGGLTTSPVSYPERMSSMSTSTYNSHASGVFSISGVSRANTSSSTSSFDTSPVPGTSAMSPITRTKAVARVPEPIYESPRPIYGSPQPSSLSDTMQPQTADSRRPPGPQTQSGPQTPSRPRHMSPTTSPTSPQTLPPMPPIPSESPRAIDPLRTSGLSAHSASSTTSTQPAPTPTPTRIIPPTITDASSSKLYLPCESNKFAGLCKSAWRAQIGDFKKAYQAQARPGGIASNRTVDFVKCKSCEFSGKVALNERGKKGPDRKVITAKESGVAYRWDFLFKSHCAQKGGSSADAEFGCMFCCALGKGTVVFKGMGPFVAHLAEHRPGARDGEMVPDAGVCDRMEAVLGRTLLPDERSEIALPAVDSQLSPVSSAGPGVGSSRF